MDKKKETIDWKLLFKFLVGSKKYFLLSIVASAIVSLADMVSPQIIRMAVDNAISGIDPDYSRPIMNIVNRFGGFEYLGKHIWIMALAILIVAIIRALFEYATNVLNNKGAETFVKKMRNDVFHHIERLPYSWHMENHTGDIIQRCTSDVDKVKVFVSEQLSNIIRIVVLLALSLFFMFKMHVGLTFVAVSMTPFILGYVLVFGKQLHKGFEKCDETEGVVSAMIQENLTGVRVVRAFANEKNERDRFVKKNRYYCSLWVNMGKIMARFFTVQDVLSMLQVMVVVVIGSVLCVKGNMTAGNLIAFVSYDLMLAWPIRRLGRMLIEMSKADVSLSRIAFIMNSQAEDMESGRRDVALNQEIRFENVNYAYDNSPDILHDVSFTIEPGSTVGIIGATGSGKSTLMLLLDKMYKLPAGKGRITIGGVDINDINTEYLRQNISMVLQESFLFSRTLSENIAIMDENLSFADIQEAAKAAYLDESIKDFAKGYDTFVGERGVTLSGGQKQRTAIARALTSKAPVIIFDDSLSAVDTETDAKIRSSLEARFGKATTIIISHRLTTLAKADKIIILENGTVSEVGTPDELKKSGGIYQKIFEIQTGNMEGGL